MSHAHHLTPAGGLGQLRALLAQFARMLGSSGGRDSMAFQAIRSVASLWASALKVVSHRHATDRVVSALRAGRRGGSLGTPLRGGSG